jgi:hypothetical protein
VSAEGFTISTKIHRRTVFQFAPDVAGPPAPVTVVMSWDSHDPFAVTFAFTDVNRAVWLTSRELLAEGLYFPAGHGDVRIAPDDNPAWLNLTLNSPAGFAEFQVPADALAGFLADTFDEAPLGEEISDDLYAEFDAWLTNTIEDADDDWLIP